MTALSDAELAVVEAREALLARIAQPETGIDLIAHLEAAVRHHDAEIVREFADQEDGLLAMPKAAVYVQGIRDGADRIETKEGS